MKMNWIVKSTIGLTILALTLADPINRRLTEQDQVPGRQCSWKFCMADWQQSFSANFLKAAISHSPGKNFIFSPRSLYISFLVWYFLSKDEKEISTFVELLCIPPDQVKIQLDIFQRPFTITLNLYELGLPFKLLLL